MSTDTGYGTLHTANGINVVYCQYAARDEFDRPSLASGLKDELVDTTWLFYPHDGELENGGVFVHPTEKSHIYLLVDDHLAEAVLSNRQRFLSLNARGWPLARGAV